MEEVDADRKDHGKKPLKKDDNDGTPSAKSEEKIITESTTDPDCGVFHKGEHKRLYILMKAMSTTVSPAPDRQTARCRKTPER